MYLIMLSSQSHTIQYSVPVASFIMVQIVEKVYTYPDRFQSVKQHPR